MWIHSQCLLFYVLNYLNSLQYYKIHFTSYHLINVVLRFGFITTANFAHQHNNINLIPDYCTRSCGIEGNNHRHCVEEYGTRYCSQCAWCCDVDGVTLPYIHRPSSSQFKISARSRWEGYHGDQSTQQPKWAQTLNAPTKDLIQDLQMDPGRWQKCTEFQKEMDEAHPPIWLTMTIVGSLTALFLNPCYFWNWKPFYFIFILAHNLSCWPNEIIQ